MPRVKVVAAGELCVFPGPDLHLHLDIPCVSSEV
jgi:hypothetical protein